MGMAAAPGGLGKQPQCLTGLRIVFLFHPLTVCFQRLAFFRRQAFDSRGIELSQNSVRFTIKVFRRGPGREDFQ